MVRFNQISLDIVKLSYIVTEQTVYNSQPSEEAVDIAHLSDVAFDVQPSRGVAHGI